MNRLNFLIIFCAMAFASGSYIHSQRISTTRHRLKVNSEAVEPRQTTADTIWADPGYITISGFDKPLNSTRETFLVHNGGKDTITLIIADIEYLDLTGRQLNKRRIKSPCLIPTLQRRLIEIPSWDKQHAYRYVKSAPSPRRQSTTFDVRIKIVGIAIPHHE